MATHQQTRITFVEKTTETGSVSGSSNQDDAKGNTNAKCKEHHESTQLGTKAALWSWLLLCYSTGPTNSMANTYVRAVLQSLTNTLGHQPGSTEKCATHGPVRCVVNFGAGEVDFNSYVLYVSAISRACEGIVTILVTGIADFSNYRKPLMLCSIILFGALALPFASLTSKTYPILTTASVLWAVMKMVQGVYAPMESSYIPQFMRAAGLTVTRARAEEEMAEESKEAQTTKAIYNKGSRVSVYGLIAISLGMITSQLIGIVIHYTRGPSTMDGHQNFLLAITIAGCLTIVLGAIASVLIPSIHGKPKPAGNLIPISLRRWVRLLRCIRRYPEAFKLCIGWTLWSTACTNFSTLIQLLFREVHGIGTGMSDSIFSVYTCTALIFACVGSLCWGYVFPHMNLGVKTWAYSFLSVNILCMLWGCIGISSQGSVGFKHGPEFWIEQVLFMSTTSALKAANRVMFASLIPIGHETQFFGLEFTLSLATGWISPLVTAGIQDSVHNLRGPMIIDLVVVGVAAGFYRWTDLAKGRRDAKVPMEEVEEE